MISITIFFHGQLRALNSDTIVKVNLEKKVCIDDLLDILTAQFPEFEKYKKYVMCAVNDEFIDENYQFKDGDKIDILPPTSGG